MSSGAPIASFREDFPALGNSRKGKPPIYFDNACTTLVPRQVIGAMTQYYTEFPGCSGTRGNHWFSAEVTNRIEGNPERGLEGSRQVIARFINAKSEKEVIFTANTSHAINIVALGIRFRPGEVVLLTDKEHNSNLLPWLRLQHLGAVEVRFVEPHPDGTFDLDRFRHHLQDGRVRLVSMAYTSNLTGYTLPAKEVVAIAHAHGATVLLDGAQTVPHLAVDVQDLDVDFLAFSIHKMCGPKGVGILYGKQQLLSPARYQDGAEGGIEPALLGGGTVSDTTYDTYRLLEPPEGYEVGVQNYPGQIAAGVAVSYLRQVGLDRVQAHEIRLNNCLTGQLLNRYGGTGWFRILGPSEAAQRGGILTFEVKRPNAVGIAEELDAKANIMVRGGAFCVNSFLNKEFGQGWMRPRLPAEHRMIYRVSLYFYNTLAECETFVDTLDEVFEERSYL